MIGNEISLKQLSELCSPSPLPKHGNDFAKANFGYYTSLYTAKKIFCLDDTDGKNWKGFFVSALSGMNDLAEAKLHEERKKRVHMLCFCNSKKEWVHMWYLYGGIRGKGARIDFTPKTLLDFINSIDTLYPIVNGKPDFTKELKVGEDIEMSYGWVCYRHESGDIEFKKETYTGTKDPKKYKNFYFIKDYSWRYENEFRIVFKNKGESEYDKLFVPLPESIVSRLKILFGPGCGAANQGKEETALGKIVKSVSRSKVGADMQLIKRNFDEILDYIKTEIEPNSEEMEKLKEVIVGR